MSTKRQSGEPRQLGCAGRKTNKLDLGGGGIVQAGHAFAFAEIDGKNNVGCRTSFRPASSLGFGGKAEVYSPPGYHTARLTCIVLAVQGERMRILTMLVVCCIGVLALAAFASAGDTSADDFRSSPRVILHQWGPARASPNAFAMNLSTWEEKLDGVDGLYLFLEKSGFAVMSAKPLSAKAVQAELEPLAGLKPKRLRYNFAVVFNDRPADLFDDWSVTLTNWRVFAAECRRAGLVGIAFDNEEYFGTWADYP